MRTNPPGESLAEEARKSREQRERGYRERALKLYPWVCGRCCREFEGKKLRELTVHHRDHNHDNNPPDGSNWELLCLYCHDDEHSRHFNATGEAPRSPPRNPGVAISQPFAGLKDLLKRSGE